MKAESQEIVGWADMESELHLDPLFPVQNPDGIKNWSEEKRQQVFFSTLHKVAPTIIAHHIKNEGNHNHIRAARGGVVAGVFDIAIYGENPLAAVIELKGYTKAGHPGKLSPKQIDWGNRMISHGWLAACFFCPYAALHWLRSNGFPVREFSEGLIVKRRG